MTSPAASLPFGRFFGARPVSREIPGFSLSVMDPVLPPEDVPLHTHHHATLVLPLHGIYHSSADGAAPDPGPSAVIYNPPGTTHRDRFQSLDGRFLAISLSSDSFRQTADAIRLPNSARSFPDPRVLADALFIARECDHWDADSPLRMEARCLHLLLRLAHRDTPLPVNPPAWVRLARELLHDQCTDRPCLADAARTLGVHPVHLSRGFRHFVGCTPSQYLTRCRLEKAMTLLRASDLPLADAALQAGFCDQSHFSKAFRRHFGLSPYAYRRILRG